MMHPLTTDTPERARVNVPAARIGRWLTAHPVLGYVLLTYVLSWPAWVLAYVTGSFALVVLGGFGPAGAAAVMLRLAGQPLGPWLRGLLFLLLCPDPLESLVRRVAAIPDTMWM